MQSALAHLCFPPSTRRGGFETSKTQALKPHAEPIVRELLQNCLDAGATVIEVRVEEASIGAIPDYGGYLQAYEAAIRTADRDSGRQTNRAADTSIAERISRAAHPRNGKVSILWCLDNGDGLKERDIFRLLDEGAGNKGAEDNSRGSFGLGHLQFFGCSDLRYVLYGGRTETGHITSSGQVLLASHQISEGDEFRSGEGILAEALDTNNTLFERRHTYGRVPLLETVLEDWLTGTQTGTAVGIVGFNFFGELPDLDRFAEATFDAAAKHFSLAILESDIRINVGANGHTKKISRTYKPAIDARREVWRKQRNRHLNSGRILPGFYADRSYDTQALGAEVVVRGVSIWVRELEERDQKTRINIFRDGMWITYEAPGLEAKDFDDLRPFDANINVTAGSPLYALVKEAEPSSHLEIDKFRLTPEKQQQYASLVDKIGDALRQHVGLVDKSDEWEDHRFAPVLGTQIGRAPTKPLPPPPETSTTGGGEEDPAPAPDPGPTPGPGPEPGPNPRPKSEPGSKKPTNKPTGHVLSHLRKDGSGKATLLVSVATEPPETEAVQVTVIRNSGSDGSCDSYVHASFEELSGVETADGQVYTPDASSPYLVVVPARSVRHGALFTVALRAPVQANDASLSVVLRRHAGGGAR